MKTTTLARALTSLTLVLIAGGPWPACAEYHDFNTGANADGIVQEVRWPYWAETTYNAIYSQTLSGADGGSCYFYGGMPSDPNGNPPCSIIWSFWPPSGTAVPGAAVTAEWTAPNMFAPPHVGEGASGKVSGAWPLITTNRWYREVFRVWRPTDGTPHLGFVGRWLRDPADGTWYHLATMRVPFAATGINGLSGFQEDFVHANRNPRRTDYRNVYYRQGGAWQKANQFTAFCRQDTEKGNAEVIEGGTAVYYEVSMDPEYVGNLDHDAGQIYLTLTLANQPAAPAIDPIVVTGAAAARSGDQLIVHWDLPATSSPQFAYTIEVFDNPDYAGVPAVSFHDIDPEARQKLLEIPGVATPHVRLTLIDVYEVAADPILVAPETAALEPASSAPGAVNGLDYAYYERATDFGALPDFRSLTPVFEGAVAYPDLTIRDQRSHYAMEFSGYLEVPADGLYTFTLYSCDGSRLVLDGQTIVGWDGQHSPAPLSGWAALAAGRHPVKVQYFFDNQSSAAGDLIDSLRVSWAGPGIPDPVEIPVRAWYRAPAAGEPAIVLTSPADGAALAGSNVLFRAEVTANGAAVDRVRFYIGDTFWGEDAAAPYELASFVWASPSNALRARLVYDTDRTLDSAQCLVTTTNMALAPWVPAAMSEHTYPQGARYLDGQYRLIGDGLNFLGRQVTGDCTIIARVADLIGTAPTPDGQTPGDSWEAGIIMRETTTRTPGTPLGNNGSCQYAAVFATVNNDTHYQDGTMSNAGGPYWSSGLGGQRWLKLERAGSTFTTSVSTDGASWQQVNSVTLSGVNATLHVGLFAYAASSQNPNVHWAAFDSVSLVGDVLGPPEVTVAPASATAYTGQAVTFTALPSGEAPFAYQWQYNGAALAGETGSTLVLDDLQPTDSGLYSVVMTNRAGSAAATAKLSVLTPLPVASEILGKDPLAYWRLNDDGPTAADAVGGFHGTGQGGVVFGEAGVASPFAGFESGNRAARFNGADSSIAIPPLGITTTNFTITGWVKRDGDQTDWAGLVFTRSSGRGAGVMVVDNTLRFSWNDNGADYNWNSGLTLSDGQWTFFALTIEPTRAILYRATGPTLSSAARTMANNPLTINNSFYLGYDSNHSVRRFKGTLDEVACYHHALSAAELTAILNASLAAVPALTLTAPAEGDLYPDPSDIAVAADVDDHGHAIDRVEFYSGSTLLAADASAPYGLTWSNVAAGAYTLVAEAVYDGGRVMTSPPVNIRVSGPVAITSHPQSQTVLQGQPAQFGVGAFGAPPYHYQWQRDGADLPGATNAAFSLAVCLPADAGGYRAVVVDRFGTSATSGVATLTVIPVPPGSYVEAVVTNRPVAYWRLGELSGSTAFDYVGGNHAAYANATLGQPGALQSDPDTAARFNGASSWVGSGVNLAANRGTFTMEGWFKLAAAARMGFWGQNDAIEFGLSNSATLQLWTSGGGQVNVTYTWGTGGWHHLAAVGNGTDLRVYMDGNLVGTGGSATANYGSSAYPFNIGGGGIWDASGNWFNGWIDEVAFYDTALSAAEVRQHFLRGLPLPTITLTAPADGAVFTTSATTNIDLAASVVANGHALTRVGFLSGDVVLGEDTTAPYAMTWTHVGPTNAALQARLVYDAGTVTSAVVNVKVWNPTPPAILPDGHVSGNTLTFSLSGTPGQHYQLEYTPALRPPATWQVVQDLHPLASSPFPVSATVSNRLGFYRAVLMP